MAMPAGTQPPLGLVGSGYPTRIGLGMGALIVYLWVIHSYKLAIGDIATLAIGLGVVLRGEQIRFPAPVMAFGGFVAWSVAGIAVSAQPDVTIEAVTDLVKLWIILFGIVNVVRNAADLRVLIIAWLAIFALYPVRGAFYNQYFCHCTDYGRVAWNFIFRNPNDLAAFSLIPLGLAAGVAYVERVKLLRYAGIAGVGVLALLIMLTQSRGAMLALGVATVVLVVGSRRKARDLFILLAMFAIATVSAPKTVWTRLAGLANVSVSEGMTGVDPENSASSRWQIWQIAAATVRQHPLTGVGSGMMPIVHANEAARRGSTVTIQGYRDTHSTFLRIASETGLPGLILYLTIWGFVFRDIERVRRRLKQHRPKEHQMLFFIELSMIAYLVASLFGTFVAISFTYLGVGIAWLASRILDHEPWYVPASAAMLQMPVDQRRRAV